LAFLLVLVRWLDLAALWQAAKEVRLGYFLSSLACLLATEILISIRLKCLMKPMDLQLPFKRLLRISFIARFYGFFLPAGVGHVLARWYKVTENRIARLDFAAVSLTEKALFLAVSIACVVLPLLLVPDSRLAGLRLGILLSSTFLAALLAVYFVFAGGFVTSRYLQVWGERAARRFGIPETSLSHLQSRLRVFARVNGRLGRAALITLGIQLAILARIGFLILAVGVQLPWHTTVWVGSLIFMIQNLPVSLAGVGLRESAFAFAFGIYGLDRELGALVGLLFFVQGILNASTGGLLELTDRGSRPRKQS
jgi:uncharacterized protein (TIRG00374 family)